MLPCATHSTSTPHRLGRVSALWQRVARQPAQWTPLTQLLAAALLAAAVVGAWWLLAPPRVSRAPAQPLPTTTPLLSTGRDHLLVYAFSNSDPQFLENLKYFIQEAIADDKLADHIIIVQEGAGLQVGQQQWLQHVCLKQPGCFVLVDRQTPCCQVVDAAVVARRCFFQKLASGWDRLTRTHTSNCSPWSLC